jgi:hypothetical protein
MNAFWNSFETLLGLGLEPRDLDFPYSTRKRGTQRRHQLHQKNKLTHMAYDLMDLSNS